MTLYIKKIISLQLCQQKQKGFSSTCQAKKIENVNKLKNKTKQKCPLWW